jgi:hypothetical protein
LEYDSSKLNNGYAVKSLGPNMMTKNSTSGHQYSDVIIINVRAAFPDGANNFGIQPRIFKFFLRVTFTNGNIAWNADTVNQNLKYNYQLSHIPANRLLFKATNDDAKTYNFERLQGVNNHISVSHGYSSADQGYVVE